MQKWRVWGPGEGARASRMAGQDYNQQALVAVEVCYTQPRHVRLSTGKALLDITVPRNDSGSRSYGKSVRKNGTRNCPIMIFLMTHNGAFQKKQSNTHQLDESSHWIVFDIVLVLKRIYET